MKKSLLLQGVLGELILLYNGKYVNNNLVNNANYF